jgi:2-dehydropantoate 2-reductase
MKSQDTTKRCMALRAAGVRDQPIFCLQNGIANEPMALRLFPNVHGVTVMMPATYTVPGVVVCHGTPKLGLFDIGRFPSGSRRGGRGAGKGLRRERHGGVCP